MTNSIAALQKIKDYHMYYVYVLSRLSCVRLFATLWTVAHQAPLSMGFSRQEYWSRLPFPPPGDLPDLGIKLRCLVSPALQVGSLPLAPPEKPIYSNSTLGYIPRKIESWILKRLFVQPHS